MKKVLFLIYQLVGGGAEKVMVDIVNRMDKSKYEITVMTVIDCSKDRFLLDDKIKYKYLFKNYLKQDRLFFKLMKSATPNFLHTVFIQGNYDIEVAFLEGIPSKIISGCNNSKTKKIGIIHADCKNIAWPSARYRNFKQEEESYNAFNNLIFVSENTKNNFLSMYKINESKSRVIYNPFDLSLIKKKSKETIVDYSKGKEEVLFVSVGRLEKVKGYDRLIKAFYEVSKIYCNIKLMIVGTGNEEKNLIKQIKDLGIKTKVELIGYKENPYKYINLGDIYICSSRSEGLNSSVIEALILNKPIIATNCGGMNEILLNSEDGLIVDNNTASIIEGMEKMVKMHLQKEIQICHEKRALEFSFKRYFQEFENIINN